MVAGAILGLKAHESGGMSLRGILSAVGCALIFLGVVYGFQKPWREYPAVEYNNFPLPAGLPGPRRMDLRAPHVPRRRTRLDGYYPRFQGDYRHGLSLWTQDYPRADRHLARAMRRLTRIDVRSVEQVVALDDDDDAFNFPWIYAVQVGEWGLTEKEGAKLREYIAARWVLHGRRRSRRTPSGACSPSAFAFAFPDRDIVELPDDDPYFHVVFDITDRPQVPGEAHLREGCKNCSDGGRGAHWRAIKDDKGRSRGRDLA